MESPLFQLASFRALLGSSEPRTVSLDITGRSPVWCDRISAFITVEPSALGAVPTLEEIQVVERLVRARVSLDRAETRIITVGDQPISVFQQLHQGPVSVPPFMLRGADQPTLKFDLPPNLLQHPVFSQYGRVYVEFVFWGQKAA